MPLQTAIVLDLVTMTALSHHPIPTNTQTRHSAPVSVWCKSARFLILLTLCQMGVFSPHRKRAGGAS